MSKNSIISKKLTEIREFHHLSMKQVAEGIGMKPDSYRNYESGRLQPNLDILSKLADFYHVTTDYLLGRETGEPETIDRLASEFNMTALEKKILDNYLSLPKHMRTNLMEFLHKSVQEVQQEANND